MTTSRFYASSLLILFDGGANPTKSADIRMIDFANCVTSLEIGSYLPTTKGPDGGYLLGLRTLISNFEEIYADLVPTGCSYIDEFGHIPIDSMPKSLRAAVELNL